MHQCSPLRSIFCALWWRIHRHPSAAQGHLHIMHPTWPLSTSYPPSTYFRLQHPFSHTLLIHSLHMSKPFQYSLIRSNRQLPFYTSFLTHLLILNSIHSWYPNQTSETLHLKNIHYPSLSTSHTHASAPYNAVSIITSSYIHLLTIPSPLLLSKLFSAHHALYPSFILCTTSLSHPTSAVTCDPRYLKQSTSSNG